MTADAWKAYDVLRERMGDGTYDMDDDEFSMALFLSTSNAATLTNADLADLTNQVANGNGYTTGGVGVTVSITNANQWLRSTATVKFDVDDGVWTASGGTITARFAAIYDATHASDGLVCMTTLDNTPADVSVTDGNSLTVAIHANGVFTVSGMT